MRTLASAARLKRPVKRRHARGMVGPAAASQKESVWLGKLKIDK